MYKKIVYSILLLIFGFCIVLPQACFAEERKDEWLDKDYNLKKIKTILINPIQKTDNIKLDMFEEKQINDFYESMMKDEKIARHNIVLITLDRLHTSIEKITGENMQELSTTDAPKYKSIMDEYIPTFVDQIMNVKLIAFGCDKYYVPEKRETYIEYVETVIEKKKSSSDGKSSTGETTIKVPVERTRVIPAHYNYVNNAGVQFNLSDSKTSEDIWMLVDIRDSEFGTKPINMTGRIFKRAKDKFVHILD